MTSNKVGVALLAEIFAKKGLKHIIISPGSRNAPIILAFAQHPKIKALSIIDERSAAFFALGMAQQTKQTVAIACTSGTAVLNYAPAIAEAYYQKVPLLVLTADRPPALVDQGDGQTIRQKNVYANYIKKSFELPENISSNGEFENAVYIINEAINLTQSPDYGPVHINLPFSEPIYNQVKSHNLKAIVIDPEHIKNYPDEKKFNTLAKIWNNSPKKLLISGMMDPCAELRKVFSEITNDDTVMMLSETTSNINGDFSCNCIDRIVSTISDDEVEDFQPDLLVTFGGHVISKMVKAFLRKNKPAVHWHIDPVDVKMNTYQCLTEGVQMIPFLFFKEILPKIKKGNGAYKKVWGKRALRSESRHSEFLSGCEYSDLKVFEALLETIPEKSNLHLGNSTPVRYAQLFKPVRKLLYFSNRGTSGIDGTVSTAAGAAYTNNQPTTLITGDLGFLYDSNALMNFHLTGNLRIIIINNSGGGIFRFIDGPGETGQLEEFFETRHNWNAKYISKNFDIPYFTSTNLSELKAVLPQFYDPKQNNEPAVLEIFTPNEKNAVILKNYFSYLKT